MDAAPLLQTAETHLRAGELAPAEALCRQVLAREPENALALHYLGVIAFQVGRAGDAIDLLRRSAQASPTTASFWATLGQALTLTQRLDEALNCASRSVELAPDNAEFRYAAGTLAGQLGLLDQSIDHLERAIQLNPGLRITYNNLGQALCFARQIDRALDHFARGSEIPPGGSDDAHTLIAASNRVYYLHFSSRVDGPGIRQAAEQWAQRFAEPLTRAASPPNVVDRSPDRRLRIGYVSPDFYEHSVGRFMHSILANHDRSRFETFCYSDRSAPDAITAMLRSCSDGWCDSAGMDDQTLAERVRQDRIDILIDLSLHMAHNRLLVFARRPAPVQVTYLGYAGTSGMSAMDWRLSDEHLDPPGNDSFYTERTMRLPRSYWCYAAPSCQAELGVVRPRAEGPITFACTNNFFKVSDEALVAWGRILARVPDSRLLIHAQPGRHLAELVAIIQRQGVDPDRVEFFPKRSLPDYFRIYQSVDIALDTFPYAGGTTTCDALWMGVPVITLAGDVAVHRAGVSLLSNVGLTDLVARNVDDYVRAAVGLASSREVLADLRVTFRRRMESSILMNPRDFLHDVESAFRHIWHQYVAP